MKDKWNRTIDYLRISVTDKCNLRCKYCMPETGITQMPHDELLTLEEIVKIVSILEELGIRKVRITGGEPLVRKNIIKLIKDIHLNCLRIEEIAMTTNGVLLGEAVEELKAAGLQSVNISLDTVDAQEFIQITGKDEYAKVEAAVARALACGLQVKLNCVGIRQMNIKSLEKVAGLARCYPVDVRFIELMPIGSGKQFDGVPADEILQCLEAVYGKAAESVYRSKGPAKYYEFKEFIGKIGFISPLSHGFCQECNRIRLTPEGRLKLCLHYDYGIELKPLLRSGKPEQEIIKDLKAKMTDAIWGKPEAHQFCLPENENVEQRNMFQIGG